tara:strand:- start:7132 stop:8796 length:1665 start_codon:yes stop_codon:yes gene_type:complete
MVKAQGSLSYLLGIGGVILVSIIVIVLVTNIYQTGSENFEVGSGSAFDNLESSGRSSIRNPIVPTTGATGSTGSVSFSDSVGDPITENSVLKGIDADGDIDIDEKTFVITFDEPSIITQVTLSSEPTILCPTQSTSCEQLCLTEDNLEFRCRIQNITAEIHELSVEAEKISDSVKLSKILSFEAQTTTNMCEVAPETGPCKALFTRYYFDQVDGTCKDFIWGGCEVTELFQTIEECQTTCETHEMDWSEIRANAVAFTSDEWGEPQLLSFSTGGWEEAAYISPTGEEFFFIYTNIDVFNFLFNNEVRVTGPIRDDEYQCTHERFPQLPPHECGKWPRADLFYTQKDGNSWTEPIPHPLTLERPVGGFVYAGENKAYFMTGFEDDVEDIGYAERVNGVWGDPIKIEIVSSEYSDSDPFVNYSDDEMFFWSNRPAEFANHNIYRSVKVNGNWQEPELLPAPINNNGDDMQTFLFEDTLYFASDLGIVGNNISIYKSRSLADNEWAEPELVISSNFAVGEPSLTADGQRLYFEQIFTDGQGNYNPDLFYVEKETAMD